VRKYPVVLSVEDGPVALSGEDGPVTLPGEYCPSTLPGKNSSLTLPSEDDPAGVSPVTFRRKNGPILLVSERKVL
jgi:hypothetical protein